MRFEDLIAPFDAATFREQYFGRRPVHIRRASAANDIFDWARLNDALAVTPYWTEDSLKIYYRNRPSLRESYCDVAGAGRSAPVNPQKVKALAALGATIVTNYVHRVCPSIDAVVHMLEREFAAHVAANAYCSFRDVQAFQTHYDLHDVFAYQAEGEKLWRVYEARADNPTTPLPSGEEGEKWLIENRGRVLFEIVMQPGDVLYLPRGQYHDAITQAETSLHVTFGVSPASGVSLFKLLETTLSTESAFRAYLPDARDPQSLRRHLSQLSARISAVMASPAFELDVLNHQRNLGNFAAEYAFPERPSSRWFTVTAPARILRRDSSYVAAFKGGEVALGSVYTVVDWMLKQGRFSLDDALTRLPGAEPAEIERTLSALVSAGVLAETPMTS
ncbi:MAG: hypothetical protein JNL81_12230 [Hyphomonadaceae bacterium]|nr:hypothetical protein [Hyphomonadaceae bacterium]